MPLVAIACRRTRKLLRPQLPTGELESAYVGLRSRATVDECGPAVAGPPVQDLLALFLRVWLWQGAMVAQAALMLDAGAAQLRTAQDPENAITAIREVMK